MMTNTEPSNSIKRSESARDHRVIVFGIPDEAESLRQLLTEVPDMDRHTTARIIRSLPGILPNIMTQDTAANLATGIRKLGLNAMAAPATEVPDFSHAGRTHHVRVTDQLLEIIDPDDKSHSWTWDKVRVVSVGFVPSDAPDKHRSIPTAASGSSHRIWNECIRIPSGNRLEAFVVLDDENCAISFASDEMNYEYLGQRRSSSSSTNFGHLISDIITHSPQPWVTPSTRAFLERSPVHHYEFRSREEFCHYTEFQALLSQQFNT